LRNAVYAGPWVTDAKRHFSKRDAPAIGLGGDYMSGAPRRQAYMEAVTRWINDGDIEGYMATHQNDPNANELWLYFQSVIAWVKATFPVYRKKEMAGLPWGELYNQFKDAKLDPKKLEDEIKTLMIDDDVTKKKGIYAYVLTREEKHLSIRNFTEAEKRAAYERQKGLCANKTKCLTTGNSDGKKVFDISEMEADHITPWSKGGKTDAANCQMLCLACNRQKGGV
jgi:HNH endonuclease